MKQLKLFPDKRDIYDWSNRPLIKPKAQKEKKRFKSYEEYIKSDEWKIKRAFALKRAGNRCEKCGGKYRIEVHHNTYDRLFNERQEDLDVLCHKCHPEADSKRSEIARFDAGLDTYASKKYGEDWADYMDHDMVADEFDDWLESQGDDW